MTQATLAEAFWLSEPGRGELRTETVALPPGAGNALVRALYSGVSRGTETLVFRGQVPPSQYLAMRAPFQAGDFPAPVKYGYSSVGRVEAGPSELIGQHVFCLYPHQSAYLVPASALTPLPDGLPPARAVLAANAETALNGLWDAAPRLGDRIIIIGAGVVGCLVAAFAARLPGCQVCLVDSNPAKAAVAEALGVDFVPPEALLEAATASPSARADIAIHASGSAQGLATALAVAGFEATVLELSWYGERPVSVPLGESFHSRRLRLIGSQVSAIATAQRGRWDYQRRLQTAFELLRDPALDALLNSEGPLAELPATLLRLAHDPSDGTLCHRVNYALTT